MDKNTKSIFFLIIVSLIIAGVFNYILGAMLDPESYKPISRENPSTSQGIAQTEKVSQTAGSPATDIHPLGPAEARQQTPVEAPAPSLLPASTPPAVPAEDYQDNQWIANIHKHSAVLSKDVVGLGTISSGSGSKELASYGQYLIQDTQAAIEENKQYVVSPKYQSAQKEWELALNDYSSAGAQLSQAANETKKSITNGGNTKQALLLVDSGSGHIGKLQELLKPT